MRILVFGGAGYIGSHACIVLAGRGHEVLVADSFVNSSPRAVERVRLLAAGGIDWLRLDLRNRAGVERVLRGRGIEAVVHFAGLKAVGDSCVRPLDYFDNNIAGTLCLLQAMQATGVRRLVFSSSATVYGDPERVPVAEDARLQVTNPYGRTKLVMEQLIGDLCAADSRFQAANLRYFNPVGAHPSGLIGEDPEGPPGNLLPCVCQVAVGRLPRLRVFGGDYPTVDGTGVRDYIHVMDLARAHADALEYLGGGGAGFTVNLGTGRGISVLQMLRAFEAASGRPVPYEVVARRRGDVAEVYADPSLATRLLGWRARLGLDAMCADAWRWQSLNPQGYGAPVVPASADRQLQRPHQGRAAPKWSSTTTLPRPGR